jgi:hypothetical protein
MLRLSGAWRGAPLLFVKFARFLYVRLATLVFVKLAIRSDRPYEPIRLTDAWAVVRVQAGAPFPLQLAPDLVELRPLVRRKP